MYSQLSTLAKNTGDIESAINYLRKANKINPEDGGAAYDLSDFYVALKQFELAEKIISVALAADTGNMQLVYGKAKVCYKLEKYDETIRLCKKLTEAGDISSSVISILGISHFMLKNYQGCIDVFKQLDASDMQTEASWYYMGMSYKALKNYKQAIISFDKALEKAISPTTDSYYAEKADSYERRGMPKTAAANYLKALEYNQRPITLYLLAALYDSKLNMRNSALRYYKRYLASDPPKDHKVYIDFAMQRIKALSR